MILGIVETEPLAATLSTLLPSSLPLAQAESSAHGGGTEVLAPILVLLLCVAAGIGTIFMLPGRRNTASVRSLGGALVLLSALVLALLLIYFATDKGYVGADVYFWIFAAIALFGALRVVTHARPVYAALYFVLTVFASAGLFILLWAEFMAAALVLIYAGAILVTYVFVIMLAASTTQAGVEKLAEHDAISRDPVLASAVGFALMGVLLIVIFNKAPNSLEYVSEGPHTYTVTAAREVNGHTVEVQDEVEAPNAKMAREMAPAALGAEPTRDPEPAFSIQALGRYLFRDQAINLELSGLILTLGMVGAILIARRRVILPPSIGGREMLSTPSTPINDDPYSIPVYGTDDPAQKAYPET
jgi:NADH-quinone oxidoreductase subunit J